MYLKFKAKNRNYERRLPFDGLTTKITSGNGWLKWETKGLYIEQAVVGKEEKMLVADVNTMMSELKEGNFANFIILIGDDDVRHSFAWDRNEWDVFQENDNGKTIARY